MTGRCKMHMLIWVVLIGMVSTPAAAWTLYKPTRVLAPEWNGVSCLSETICTDDPSRYKEALALYDEAYTFVHSSVGQSNRNHGSSSVRPKSVSKRSDSTKQRPTPWDLRHCRQPTRVEGLLPPA